MLFSRTWFGTALLISTVALIASAETIRVRYPQGSTHGFLELRTFDGKIIATGESTQTVRGNQVTSRLTFHFRDGSIDDDETIFSQKGVFRLLSDHHRQHGPWFPKPIDLLINSLDGELIWRDEGGTDTQTHIDLPEDVSNGLPPNLLVNISPSTAETKVSYIVAGKKPRLIHVSIKPTGTTAFSVGTLRRKATDFTLHVNSLESLHPSFGSDHPTSYLAAGRQAACVRSRGRSSLRGRSRLEDGAIESDAALATHNTKRPNRGCSIL
ncbi:hypothetical protein HDF16_005192 [Granulicella aggregans]|uniref:Uncharacterized protein n=1 Tax=Granulicella aggregans TaxID=474949 RepID=A0A7W7ZIG9_9BACT|nr:hypothetical protein [Granulicella aggregans]